MELEVQIVRFVEEHQPPIVAAEFSDAEGRRHTFVEKVAIFSSDWLRADSKYPQPGAIRCEIVARWQDAQGRRLVRVTTEKPDSVESTEGLSEFVVMSTQVSSPAPVSQGQ
jgi:hypothetical protein